MLKNHYSQPGVFQKEWNNESGYCWTSQFLKEEGPRNVSSDLESFLPIRLFSLTSPVSLDSFIAA